MESSVITTDSTPNNLPAELSQSFIFKTVDSVPAHVNRVTVSPQVPSVNSPSAVSGLLATLKLRTESDNSSSSNKRKRSRRSNLSFLEKQGDTSNRILDYFPIDNSACTALTQGSLSSSSDNSPLFKISRSTSSPTLHQAYQQPPATHLFTMSPPYSPTPDSEILKTLKKWCQEDKKEQKSLEQHLMNEITKVHTELSNILSS